MRIGVGLEKIRAYLEENKERHIKRIQRLVEQPSVSVEEYGVRECAELLVELHKEIGCEEAKLVETVGLLQRRKAKNHHCVRQLRHQAGAAS